MKVLNASKAIIGLFLLTLFIPSIEAAPQEQAVTTPIQRINQGTVRFIAGEYGKLSLEVAAELATILDEGDTLRIIPIIGRGSLRNMTDMIYLKGIDISIVQSDVLEYFLYKNTFPEIKEKIKYISKLYIQDLYIVANKDIKSINDLSGKYINVVSQYSGEFVTAQNIFGALGIPYKPVFFDQNLALEKLRKGEIAATLLVSGRPSPFISELKQDDGLKLISVPFSIKMPRIYLPTTIQNKDYPSLIPEGTSIPTIGQSAIFLVFNFKPNSFRFAKVARFTDALLSRFEEFKKPPRHPKWREVNLASAVRGWQRFGPVDRWLKENAPKPAALIAKKKKPSLKELFNAFIQSEIEKGTGEELLRLKKEDIFKRFLVWQRERNKKRVTHTASTKKRKRSLKKTFQAFIQYEEANIGLAKLARMGKDELYSRFLAWQKVQNRRR